LLPYAGQRRDQISNQLLPGGLICPVPLSESSPKEPQIQQLPQQPAMSAQRKKALLQRKQQKVPLPQLPLTLRYLMPAQQQQKQLQQALMMQK
jgi:hypothetical protein